jgi:serine/threonine protein kinase
VWCQVYQAAPAGATDQASANYALKLPRDDLDDPGQAVAQLQRESLIARSIDHPHVCCVLASHLDRPPFYLVMPLLRGSTLRSHLNRVGQMAIPDALWVARQVADACRALHEQGWVHCDVKPDNVHVAPNGHATLCDLGLASPLDPIRRAGALLAGTPAYMPPEAFTSGAHATAATDSYGLGIMLHESLAGQRPFPHAAAAELAAAHRLLRAPDPRLVRPDVPAPVVRLLQRLLAKEPLRRPTGQELVDWLVNLEIDLFDLRETRGD